MLMQDTRAIVTGGASGLGLAVAELVVAAGGKVALFDVNDQAGVDAVRALGTAASFHKVDVTSEQAVGAAVAAATELMGGLNLAVSCAGVGWPKRMLGKEGSMPGEFFRKVIEINLIGTLLVCKEAAAAMQKNSPNSEGERGALVMTASVAAFDGQIGQVAYAASKGGVVSMTRGLARTFGPHKITVNSVSPGQVHTPMLMKDLKPEIYEAMKSQTPLGYVADPEEIAGPVVFLASSHASYITGATINISGGLLMY